MVAGENGSGKSNLLEAIYMIATGKSFRADREDEVISYGEKTASIECTVDGMQLRIFLSDGTTGVTRKRFEINGVPKRMMDFVGNFRAVMFGPQDLELVTGSPGIRRRYLDFVISQTDREYRRCLVSYEKGLRQRNKLLERIREGLAYRNQLFFWDRLLIKNGEYITDKREDYLGKLNSFSKTSFDSKYDKSVISEIRLKQYEAEEVAAATTLVGPHRDDFWVEADGRDVSKYGSRGEQRMAVLWLKQGELKYLTTGEEMPVTLLDDIFSELDHLHRDVVLEMVNIQVKNGGQVIMTTADEHMTPVGKEWVKIKL